jgi:hypothetical protein
MSEDWVKAHAQLFSGFWAGVPRAFRFHLLELAIAAKPMGGYFELPFGTQDPLDGIVKMFGGADRKSRREVREAITFLSSNASIGVGSVTPTVVFCREGDRYLVTIPQFHAWNAITSSADRMRRKREADRARELLREDNTNSDVTGDISCDALEERRGEERRREIETCDADASPSVTSKPKPDKSLDESVARVWDALLAGLARRGKRDPKLTKKRRAAIRARLGEYDEPTVLAGVEVFTARDSWWMREDRHQPELLFRNCEQFEKVLARSKEYGVKIPQKRPQNAPGESDRPQGAPAEENAVTGRIDPLAAMLEAAPPPTEEQLALGYYALRAGLVRKMAAGGEE